MLRRGGEVSARPVELLDFGSDIDCSSVAPTLGLVIAQIDTSQEVEEEDMDLKPRSDLRGLLSNKNKGQSSKDAPKEQVTAKLPPPLPPSTDPALQPLPNLRRKRPVEELEEGKVGPEKAKQQKKDKEPKEKRTKSVDSRDEVAMRRERRTWSPRLELDGTPISWDATLWESQRGQASYLAEALQQPLLLPRDMEGLWATRQPDLFMLLKRDLAMVNEDSSLFNFFIPHLPIRYFLLMIPPSLLCKSLNKSSWLRSGPRNPGKI